MTMTVAVIVIVPFEYIHECLDYFHQQLQQVQISEMGIETGLLRVPYSMTQFRDSEMELFKHSSPTSEFIQLNFFDPKAYSHLASFLEPIIKSYHNSLFYVVTSLGLLKKPLQPNPSSFYPVQSFEIHGQADYYYTFMYFHSCPSQMRTLPSQWMMNLPTTRLLMADWPTSMGAIHLDDWFQEVLFKLGKSPKYGA